MSAVPLRPRAISSPRSAALWIVVTGLAFAVGLTLSSLLIGAVARPLAGVVGGLLYIAAYGAVAGAGIGTVQLLLLGRAVSPLSWVARTMAGAAIGFVLLAVVGELLGRVIDPQLNVIVGEGAIEDLSGALLGLCLGVAQWPVLRERVPSARSWVLASAIGVGVGYGTAAGVLELLEIAVLKANLVPSFAAIVGLFVGVAQTIVLTRSRT